MMQGKYCIICRVELAFRFEHDKLIMIILKGSLDSAADPSSVGVCRGKTG